MDSGQSDKTGVSSAQPDDLRNIGGIGPETQKALLRAGISTPAQLAERSPEALAELLSGVHGMSAARIRREKWVDQARALAAQSPQSPQGANTAAAGRPSEDQEPGEASAPETLDEAPEPATRQGSVIFTVHLELHPDGSVRRTLAKHGRTESSDEEVEQWLGWDAARLLAFIEQRADLRRVPEPPRLGTPAAMPAEAVPPPAAPRLEPAAPPVPPPVDEEPAAEPAPAPVGPSTPPAAPPAPPPVRAEPALRGVLHMRRLETGIVGSPGPGGLLRQDQLLRLRLMLDLSEVIAPLGAWLSYKAVIYAREIGGPGRITVAEGVGNVQIDSPTQIELSSQSLPPGLYRLIATASLALADQPDRPQLVAFLESGLMDVV